MFMCAPDRSHNHACRVFASVAPQQRHLVARNCSIPRKRRLADTSSDAGMTLDKSTCLNLKKSVAAGPAWLLCRAFAKHLVSFSPFGSPVPRGGIVSGSCSRDAMFLSYRSRFTSFPNLYWALLELVISASCAGSTSAIDFPQVSCSPGRKTLARQLSVSTFAIASSETPCTSRRSLTLLQMLSLIHI